MIKKLLRVLFTLITVGLFYVFIITAFRPLCTTFFRHVSICIRENFESNTLLNLRGWGVLILMFKFRYISSWLTVYLFSVLFPLSLSTSILPGQGFELTTSILILSNIVPSVNLKATFWSFKPNVFLWFLSCCSSLACQAWLPLTLLLLCIAFLLPLSYPIVIPHCYYLFIFLAHDVLP